MPRDDRRFDERVKSNRDAAEELDAVARHSAASNGFGAPEVALSEIGTEPPAGNAWCQTVVLGRRELLCLRDGCGALLRLYEGAAWLTQERALQDVMLRRGESFRLDRDGLAVVEALCEATITISARSRAVALAFEILRPVSSAARSPWSDLARTLVRTVESLARRYRVGGWLMSPARRLMCRS